MRSNQRPSLWTGRPASILPRKQHVLQHHSATPSSFETIRIASVHQHHQQLMDGCPPKASIPGFQPTSKAANAERVGLLTPDLEVGLHQEVALTARRCRQLQRRVHQQECVFLLAGVPPLYYA